MIPTYIWVSCSSDWPIETCPINRSYEHFYKIDTTTRHTQKAVLKTGGLLAR